MNGQPANQVLVQDTTAYVAQEGFVLSMSMVAVKVALLALLTLCVAATQCRNKLLEHWNAGLTQQVDCQDDHWQINCNQEGAERDLAVGYALVQLHPYDRGLWPRLLHGMLC